MGTTTMSSNLISIIIIILLIMEESTIFCLSKNNIIFNCVLGERKALLKFKASFSDDLSNNRLSSWKANSDCCIWAGVECDNATRHVVKLDLRNTDFLDVDEYGNSPSLDSNADFLDVDEYGDSPSLDSNRLRSDTIDSSLLELKFLSYLDLSGNDFNGSSIPTFLGSMKQLQYLNLSYAEFSGIVPHQLGNLSSLRTLHLGQGHVIIDGTMLIADDVTTWAGNLSSLEYLEMSAVYLGGTKDIIEVLNMLPSSLVDLRLSFTGLDNTNLPHADCVNRSTLLFTNVQHLDLSRNFFGENYSFCFLHNMTSLSFLDLSNSRLHQKADWISHFLWDKCHLKSLNLMSSQFYGDISLAFRNFSGCWGRNLENLNLGRNEFNGHLPEEFGELRQLTNLHVGGNNLVGHIPSSLGNLKALRSFDISFNQMGGEIPISLGQLSNLERIDISSNVFQGTLSEAHFANLSRLEYLDIGYNNMSKFNVRDDWVPPFHQLKYLNMRSVEIIGSRQFPQWIQTQKALQVLNLMNCSIRGTLPAWLGSLMNLTELYLSNNHIEGPIILELPSGLIKLYLADNMITNHLPSSIGHMMTLLQHLDLSRNFLNGSLPESLC